MLFLARLVATTRLFSTSAVAQYPKLKSHSGAKKRFKSLANGFFKRARAGHRHLNVHKSPARKNHLAQTTNSQGTQTAMLKKLLPYGSW
ncbi:ribosomal protein L35 [Obba rivulosa]|uniref:50S ribosomal protein L35 n=1 Tax=Obba rivulosa TaxID=1052685 RepID=A0A8E2DER8_9APHY|nr:ribosomal protein L35 [Obba rivulosa]